MNNTFSTSRLRKLMTRDWNRFRVMSLILLSLQTIARIIVLNLLQDTNENSTSFTLLNRVSGFIFTIILTIITTPSEIYPKANRLNPDLSFLMTPASNLEKFITIVLYSAIIMPLIAALMYVAADSIIALIPGSGYDCFLWQYIAQHSTMNTYQWWLTLEHCLLLSATAILINTLFSGSFSYVFAVLIPCWALIKFAQGYMIIILESIVRSSASVIDIVEIGIALVLYYIAYRLMSRIKYRDTKKLIENM